jgi:hypothetical protein
MQSQQSPTDYAIVCAMERFGGSFVQALGLACRLADPVNFAKIKATWPEYWAEYAEVAKLRAARGEGPK